ncbi:MAG: hypothetical protein OEY85_10095 [Rhodospirillales bacterium]|nr:hypothetical protein [Rhodospirillales bacterium]
MNSTHYNMYRDPRPGRRLAAVCAVAVLACGLAAFSTPDAAAQQQRYSTWQDQSERVQFDANDQDEKLDKMIQELNNLINEADRYRAADPKFIRDLRKLARRYETPWRTRLLFDDFSDGDFTRNPAWTVTAGRFWIERGYGLRSTPALVQQQEERSSSRDQLRSALLGVLRERLGEQEQQQQQTATRGHAAINVRQAITNSFSIRFELTSWEKRGQFELGTFQDGNAGVGYRLIYQPGGAPSLRLMRAAQQGSGVVGAYAQALELEDQRVHTVEWTRSRRGNMVVKVDGKELIRAVDRGTNAPFNGILAINDGGDYVLRSITVMGTK